MANFPCLPMILSWASLSVAAKTLKSLNTSDPTANSLLLELEMAANLAEAFDKTWHSIYWNKAKKETKVRVSRSLTRTAEMVFDHLREAVSLFDQLCDEQSLHSTIPLTFDWLEVKRCLKTAKDTLNKTHAKFLGQEEFLNEPKQLQLFTTTRY